MYVYSGSNNLEVLGEPTTLVTIMRICRYGDIEYIEYGYIIFD